jgi:hypothetical protein
MQPSSRWIGIALTLAGLSLATGAPEAAAVKNEPAKIEAIAGTALSRVTMTARAVERLGIQTGQVQEKMTARSRVIAGEVVEAEHALPIASVDGIATAVAVVRAYPAEDAGRLARERPARVRLLTGDGSVGDLEAQPLAAATIAVITGAVPAADEIAARPLAIAAAEPLPDESLYYAVAGAGHGLARGQRVLVEVTQDEAQRKLVPESAIVFDPHGAAWIYTNPEPLTFIRHPVEVERIDRGMALLAAGPPTGTVVMTVGAPLLLGTEFKVGH